MHKIAVMGESRNIGLFSSLGMSVFIINDENEAKNTLKKLYEEDYGIIYITKKLSEKIKDETDKYYNDFKPAIITLPGIEG